MIPGKSYVRYSPGIIFLDKVASLKVNFIGAKESDATEYKTNYTNISYSKLLEISKEITEEDGKYYNVDRDSIYYIVFDTSSTNVDDWQTKSTDGEIKELGATLSYSFTPYVRCYC